MAKSRNKAAQNKSKAQSEPEPEGAEETVAEGEGGEETAASQGTPDPREKTDPLSRRRAAFDAAAQNRQSLLEEEGIRAPSAEEEETGRPQEGGGEKAEKPAEAEQPEGEGAEAEGEEGEQPEEGEPGGQPAQPSEPTYTVMTENGPMEVPASQIRTKTTIDGQEMEVSGDQLHRGFQIEQTARNNLDYANRALQQLQQYEQQLRGQQPGQQPQAGPQAQPGQPPAADPNQPQQQAETGPEGMTEADLKKIYEGIALGDEEEGVKALNDLVSQLQQKPQNQGLTEEELELRVLDRVEYNQSLARFGQEYPELANDPYLRDMTGKLGSDLMQQAVQWAQANNRPRPSYWEVMDEAGKRMRQRLQQTFGQPAQQPQPGQSTNGAPGSQTQQGQTGVQTDQSARTDRKRAQAQTPTPRSQSPMPQRGRSQQQTTEVQRRRSAIQDIQKSRGQSG